MSHCSRFVLAAVAVLTIPAFMATAVTTAAFAQPAGHTPHKAHPHHHKRGRDLLGDKIHQDGKHDVDKTASGKTVSAEVKGGKVSNMTADNQPMKKLKSHRKLASLGYVMAGFVPDLQLAQDDSDDYYGYCYDDGIEVDCYWYDAADVDTSGDWDDYDGWDASSY
jgi:hypothetical protein